MKVPSFLMTNFQRYFKVPLFDKMLTCRNFWQYNGAFLNIFHIWHESPFYLLIVISAVFYSTRDIEMGHSLLRTILTAWKASKYEVSSGPYFPVFGLNTDQKKSVFGKFPRSDWKKISILLASFLDFLGNNFLNSSTSESKPWNRPPFLQNMFKKYCIVSHFLNMRDIMAKC